MDQLDPTLDLTLTFGHTMLGGSHHDTRDRLKLLHYA
jgi:hypothetical protein